MQRPVLLSFALAGALACLYSCSMHASVLTDEKGQVVSVSAVRFDSSLPRVALGLLIAAKGLAFELRWAHGLIQEPL